MSAPLTALLVASKFTSVQQGYYYTFASLLAMQVFLELGFGICIIHIVSHDFALLGLGENGDLEGPALNRGRIKALYIIARQWFQYGSVAFFAIVGMVGEVFFSARDATGHWRLAWWSLCAGTALGLSQIGPTSILQGCNFLGWVAYQRAVQALIKSGVLIIAIMANFGLYAASMASLLGGIYGILSLRKRWGPFFGSLCKAELVKVHWKREIFPFQSRIAVSWMSGFFIFSSFSPILFATVGPAAAGRFGITWSIISGITNLSQIFVTTKQTEFGMLNAQNRYAELKTLWSRSVGSSVAVSIALNLFFAALVIFVIRGTKYELRLLSISELAPLAIASVASQYVNSIAVLARSEKREAFLMVSVVSALFITLGNLFWVRQFGVSGMTWNYCIVTLVSGLYAHRILQGTQMSTDQIQSNAVN